MDNHDTVVHFGTITSRMSFPSHPRTGFAKGMIESLVALLVSHVNTGHLSNAIL